MFVGNKNNCAVQ